MAASLVRVRLAFATEAMTTASRHLTAATEELLRRAECSETVEKSVQREIWADNLRFGCSAVDEIAAALRQLRIMFAEAGE